MTEDIRTSDRLQLTIEALEYVLYLLRLKQAKTQNISGLNSPLRDTAFRLELVSIQAREEHEETWFGECLDERWKVLRSKEVNLQKRLATATDSEQSKRAFEQLEQIQRQIADVEIEQNKGSMYLLRLTDEEDE